MSRLEPIPILALIVAICASAVVSAADAPGDLLLPRSQGAVSEEMTPRSIFPHWIHRVNYRCDACHDRLFKMELGATDISMAQMQEGKSCGTCHDGATAFRISFDNCSRCHVSGGTGGPED